MLVKDIKTFGGMGYDSNIYLIDNELLIDTGTGRMFSDIKKEMGSVGVRLIVNTHYHFDHTGGNKKFRDWLKSEILIHKMDKDFVEKAETLAEKFGSTARVMTVDKVIKEGQVFSTKNFNFHVIHTPGHTPGSICLYDPEHKMLISGDTLMSNGVGRVDLPNSDRTLMIESLKKISELSINYLFPGHGPPRIGGIDFYVKQLINSMENGREVFVKEI